MLVTWGTNISINYGNEYFDWNMDRPGQVAAIKREVEKRKVLEAGGPKGNAKGGIITGDSLSHIQVPQLSSKRELNEKIMG
jgi:hypothetical protein